jgi:hypothetical protein
LLFGTGLFMAVWHLRKLNSQVLAIANHVGNSGADSGYGVTHPALSVEQLRRARQQFESKFTR